MVLLKMPMEAADKEVIEGSNHNIIIKGKRRKRPRPASPLTLAIITSSSSSSMVSPNTASFEFAGQNKEDMANCLIHLARGHHHHHQQQQQNVTSKLSEPPLPQTSSKLSTGALSVYQCKTCNQCFPSFQALGGHRASHKRPKLNNNSEDNNKKATVALLDQEVQDRHRHHHHQFLDNNMSTTLSFQIGDKGIFCGNIVNFNNKVHECSIYSTEFSSGQALGGHMRRHWAVVAATSSTTPTPTTTTTSVMSLGTSSSPDHLSQESNESGNILQLDLNLPAPDEEDDYVQEQHKFHFAPVSFFLA